MGKRQIQGRLIVVEGPDGVGKSTLCQGLLEALRADHVPADLFAFPGNDPGTIGELVYLIHHDPRQAGVEHISSLAIQTLHVAAHIDAIERNIMPLLEVGRVVILDRFWWSAWVYGLAAGCHRRKLSALIEAERCVWGRVRPTLAVLLQRKAPIDRDGPAEHWQTLAREYERLVDRERRLHPVTILNNVDSPQAAVEALVERIKVLCPPDVTPSGEQLKLRFGAQHEASVSSNSHILPLHPTAAYDTYWRFAAERQEIFFNRIYQQLPPWTSDPILREYKFTNAYRASDRVSQYLIRKVIYRSDLPSTSDEVFFRIMLFKFFNKIETWESLEAAVGPITLEGFTFARYDRVLTAAMDQGESIYSAAYIMPSGGRTLGHDRKHRNHLTLLERMLSDSLPDQLADCSSMQKAFTLLKSYPSIGDFLAYQYAIDINYSEITGFSEADFVVPGPGALDGIRKCFSDCGGLSEPEIIKFMSDRQEQEFLRLGLSFRSLWGRPLQLIDCQNLFCEVDKYSRVYHPEIQGLSGRSRIKQRFEETPMLPPPWYPPKWGLNDRIAADPRLNGARVGNAGA